MRLNNIEIGPKTKAVIEKTVSNCHDIQGQKGFPRGERLPFSKNKMRCACYVALGIPGVNISAMAGVAHGTVRMWKGEPRFREIAATVREYLKNNELERRKTSRRAEVERRQSKVFGR